MQGERFSDIPAERALIGAVLINPPLLDEIDVPAEAFFSSVHNRIWKTILEIYASSGHIDAVILQGKISDDEAAMEALAEALAGSIFANNATQYAKSITTKWMLRRIHAAIMESAEDIRLSRLPPGEIAQRAIDKIDEASSGALQKKQIVGAPESVSATLNLIDSGKAVGITTGFDQIDSLFRFESGSFVILAARPAMGKTALADQMAERLAMENNPVLLASLEMPHEEITMRRLARRSGVPISRIASGRLTDQEKDALAMAANELRELDLLYTYDNPTASISEIATAARKIKRKHGTIGLVVIDYIQQMVEGTVGQNVQEVTAIARNAKVLARELDTTVLGLSQLSRAVEYRNDKRPLLSDLRESGGLEQAANVVAFIYRDEYYQENPPSEERGRAEIIIRKNRNGPLGTARLKFTPELAMFTG